MFKQPRVPEYRASAGTGKYLKDLTIFLKDFCLLDFLQVISLQIIEPHSRQRMCLDQSSRVNLEIIAFPG